MGKRQRTWVLRIKVLGLICVVGAVLAFLDIGVTAKVAVLVIQIIAIGLLLAWPEPPAGE